MSRTIISKLLPCESPWFSEKDTLWKLPSSILRCFRYALVFLARDGEMLRRVQSILICHRLRILEPCKSNVTLSTFQTATRWLIRDKYSCHLYLTTQSVLLSVLISVLFICIGMCILRIFISFYSSCSSFLARHPERAETTEPWLRL